MNTRKRYRLVYCFLLPYGTVGIVFSFLVLPLSPEITVAAAVIWCVAVFLLFGDSRCPSCGRDLAYGDVKFGTQVIRWTVLDVGQKCSHCGFNLEMDQPEDKGVDNEDV